MFWFRKSAEQGNAAAMYNIGVCYEHGCGVEMDYEEAIKYYQKAADKGIKKAFISIEDLNKKRKLEKSEFIINGHEYVDLGLPSGLKWATCNVGANSPEEYGDYYAWGETKDEYTEENSYTYGVKMNDISGNPKYDVARKKWGGKWRMPTYDEMEELIEKCSWEWIEQNGTNSYKVTGPNGNSIFLPAAGIRYGSSLHDAGSVGYYWSSTPREDFDYGAYYLAFLSYFHSMGYGVRYDGLSVRPVLE